MNKYSQLIQQLNEQIAMIEEKLTKNNLTLEKIDNKIKTIQSDIHHLNKEKENKTNLIATLENYPKEKNDIQKYYFTALVIFGSIPITLAVIDWLIIKSLLFFAILSSISVFLGIAFTEEYLKEINDLRRIVGANDLESLQKENNNLTLKINLAKQNIIELEQDRQIIVATNDDYNRQIVMLLSDVDKIRKERDATLPIDHEVVQLKQEEPHKIFIKKKPE